MHDEVDRRNARKEKSNSSSSSSSSSSLGKSRSSSPRSEDKRTHHHHQQQQQEQHNHRRHHHKHSRHQQELTNSSENQPTIPPSSLINSPNRPRSPKPASAGGQIVFVPSVSRTRGFPFNSNMVNNDGHVMLNSDNNNNGNARNIIGSNNSATASTSYSKSSSISKEQLEFGPLLKSGKVQVLYRSPDSDSVNPLDRHLKEEQAKQVAPNLKQSPVAIINMNPTYELQNKPLVIEYPAIVENLRLNNTGFSWEVKLPYQISMITALHGAHLNTCHRYRLDQFHCHWGETNDQGSEHTVDNRSYSAELHFVHYNMDKYHTFSKAARHSDGLVVLGVFIDAHEDHRNHAELEKIVTHLKSVQLKGDHSLIRQAVRIDNLLPAKRSYWSYQGSLTTPPYFESVTWFIFKQPIKCSQSQIQRFRNLKSSLNHDDGINILSNHRKTQPLNGRTIVTYDESNYN